MVKSDSSWPRPQHVAWQSSYLNPSSMLAEPSLLGLPAYAKSTAGIFPAVSAFPGFTAPAIPSLKTELTNEVHQGFVQSPNPEPSLKETHTGRALQNANHASLQNKLLIFDHSGNMTRLVYGPVVPLVHSTIVTATKFAQGYGVNVEGKARNKDQKFIANYSLPEVPDKDRTAHEESEMHEDTEEINALLYSDDDDEYDDDYDNDDDNNEVTSTGRSPLETKRTHLMEEQFEDTNEDIASSDWPNKRLKSIDGGYNISLSPVDCASSLRLNEMPECVSDAESKLSSGCAHCVEKTVADNSMVDDIQLKTDKIRESLKVLESLIPGTKGKEPLLVIDGTIQYLKSLMSQTGANGVKYDLQVG
ncbi:hypothetical protein TanjilG_00388 [Lupinus angustifolius]|uniref:BHLH domain-containing protein n=1 Tax=Lupinus angustifolius TaxID=3871 RepID=A0A1J7HVL7_LUPAN|nr:PREDICTED: transcription factor bHLH143-like [Lupinus angustifolius]OIW10450.1 hypothetical protein TanjilG_00388 [Lupinus angustifolius]